MYSFPRSIVEEMGDMFCKVIADEYGNELAHKDIIKMVAVMNSFRYCQRFVQRNKSVLLELSSKNTKKTKKIENFVNVSMFNEVPVEFLQY